MTPAPLTDVEHEYYRTLDWLAERHYWATYTALKEDGPSGLSVKYLQGLRRDNE